MAQHALQEAKVDTARVWQQRSVRAGILAAARRIAERDGAGNLTLGAVANEADFAVTTVFAYFMNKNELMVAVVADDLATLAREMRDIYPLSEPKAVEEPEAEAIPEETPTKSIFDEEFEISDSSPVVDAAHILQPLSAEEYSQLVDLLNESEAENDQPAERDPEQAEPISYDEMEASVVPTEAGIDLSDAVDFVDEFRLDEEPEAPVERVEPAAGTDEPREESHTAEPVAEAVEPEAQPEHVEEATAEAVEPEAQPEHTEETVAEAVEATAELEHAEPEAVAETVADAADLQVEHLIEEPVSFDDAVVTHDQPLANDEVAEAETIAQHGEAVSPEPVAEEPEHVIAPEASDEVELEHDEHAEEAYAGEPRPARMPLVEKKWSIQTDGEQDGDQTSVLARLEATVAKLEARPVDAWLERRLRELERMIASLEERQGNSERSNGTASGIAIETVSTLHAKLEGLEKKQKAQSEEQSKSAEEHVSAAEKRLKQMLGELRTLAMEASSRLDVLEKSPPVEMFRPSGELLAMPAETGITEPPRNDCEAKTDEEPKGEADKPEDGEAASYLSHARRSAIAAAAQTVAQPNDPMQRFASSMSSLKANAHSSRMFIAAGIGLLVVLLGAAIVLKQRAAWSPQPAAQTIAQQAVHPKKLPMLSPQIHLAALATRGNSSAELLLGLEHLDGTGVVKNDAEAEQWITRSATHGNAVAQFWLGSLYADGRGVKADPALAMHWYEEAAMQGNRKAMHQLAVSYAEGWGADKNYAEAARWFSRAASLGYVDSAFNLGVLYERGLGMPQSLLDAYKWYAIAAALGDKGSLAHIDVLKGQMSADDIAAATQAATAFVPDAVDPVANTTPDLKSLPKI